MEAEHLITHPHPADPTIFERHPGEDRLACGCASLELLEDWFGHYLRPLREQGAHVSEYDVPASAIVDDSPDQLLFTLRRATAMRRSGRMAPALLIRSSAGSRAQIIAASNGRYDYDPRPAGSFGIREVGLVKCASPKPCAGPF